MKQKCEQIIAEAFDRADEKWGMKFRRPLVLWRHMGRRAGLAKLSKGAIYELHLNPFYLEQDGENFVNRTPLHEVAHFVAYELFGCTGHSDYWKAVLKSLGGVDLERCHDFSAADAPRAQSVKRAKYLRALESL